MNFTKKYPPKKIFMTFVSGLCFFVSLSNLREELQAKFQIEVSSLNPPEYIHV